MNFPKIPPRLKIKNRVIYEIVWVDSFSDANVVGECRFESKQIALKSGLSERETYKTLIHEVLHAMEFERGIKISHKAIYQLEDAVFYLLFHNAWE